MFDLEHGPQMDTDFRPAAPLDEKPGRCNAAPVELPAVECRSLLHGIADCSLLQTDILQIQISAHYGTVMLTLTAAAQ